MAGADDNSGAVGAAAGAPGHDAVVLVTGGAGFIGSHLVDALLRLGHRVVVLDDLSTGSIDNLDTDHRHLRVVRGDVTNAEDCAGAVRGVTAVVHLAAMSKVAPSLESPAMAEFCQAVNVSGTMNMLQAASRAGSVRQFVYAGSSTCYGNSPTPQAETQLPDLITPYAASKYQGEILTQMFARVYGLPTCVLRFFMVYGPRQPVSGAYATVNGVFLKQALEGGPLTVQGSGQQSRDFIHVADVAGAILAALRADGAGLKGQSINVGSGQAHSVAEVAAIVGEEMARCTGRPQPDTQHVERRRFDMDATLAATTLAEGTLGWRAAIGFEEGMREWVRREVERRQRAGV